MAHYIELNSAEFEGFLVAEGFGRTVQHNEVVYTKEHNKSGIVIKCYTSIQDGNDVARDCGRDAIRCVAIAYRQGRGYPIFKAKRCHRSGSQQAVHERVKERIAEAVARCDSWLAEQAAKFATPATSPINGEYFGNVGDNVRLILTVSERTQWNGKFCFTFKDDAGRSFCFWTDKDKLCVNDTYDVGAKIIGHATFKGTRQTKLADMHGKRCVQ